MQRDVTESEIRGITIRNFVWLMGGIIGLIISGMVCYFNIMRKLDGLDAIQGNINVLSTKVENNTSEIKNMQQHVIPSLDNRMSIMEEKMKDKIFIKDTP